MRGLDNNSQKHFYDSSSTSVEYLCLDEIRRDGDTQPRVAMDWKHVKLLEEQIQQGARLEPIVIFYDGEFYWLADGFHRWQAHQNQAEEVIACTIYQGSRRDAVLYSVGANADNKPALPRTREDKRKAVITLLTDPEWKLWSDREISRSCRVGNKFVGDVRRSLCSEHSEKNRIYKTKHGNVSKMDISNIGKNVSKQEIDTVSITIKPSNPLFAGQSGKIAQIPNPTSAIVELDNGLRELIHLKDLEMKQTSDSDQLQLAHHLKLVDGGLVEIHAPNNSKINARLGRIANITDCTVQVWVRNVESMTMHLHTLKHQQVEPVSFELEPQLALVRSRIDLLKKCNLDPYEVEMINLLERPVAFTPIELEYLACIEKRYQLCTRFGCGEKDSLSII